MAVAVGLDVGGTKVAGALVDQDGRILRRIERPSPAQDVDALMEVIYGAAEELAAGADPAGVGLGAAGMVEWPSGVLRSSPNIAWAEVPLRELVGGRMGLPCLVDNDANTAAWGEYRFGAGQGRGHVLLVTVGTGIGGGIVIDGELYRGAHGFAAEIGHIIVEPGGPLCGCGNRGCWEQVASGRALDRMALGVAPRSLIADLAEGGNPSGYHVARAAAQGDEEARGMLAEVARRLGEGLAGLANVLDPELIVVGGGVAEVGEPFLDPARAAFVDALEAPEHRPKIPVVPALLGNDAGAIGAADMALAAARSGGR